MDVMEPGEHKVRTVTQPESSRVLEHLLRSPTASTSFKSSPCLIRWEMGRIIASIIPKVPSSRETPGPSP